MISSLPVYALGNRVNRALTAIYPPFPGHILQDMANQQIGDLKPQECAVPRGTSRRRRRQVVEFGEAVAYRSAASTSALFHLPAATFAESKPPHGSHAGLCGSPLVRRGLNPGAPPLIWPLAGTWAEHGANCAGANPAPIISRFCGACSCRTNYCLPAVIVVQCRTSSASRRGMDFIQERASNVAVIRGSSHRRP